MKYVKIAVPDDFDTDVVSYKDENNKEKEATVWSPKYKNVLDHGFVGLVDFMGDDKAIVNAARVSYGTGTKKVNKDEGLIRYLMRHHHTTPSEMVTFKFHLKAPIFVFRQLIRHRTFSINEYSGRYSVMDSDTYIPKFDKMAPQSTSNRQGRDDAALLNQNDYNLCTSVINEVFDEAYQAYHFLLGPTENGTVPRAPESIQRRIDWAKESAVRAALEARRRALENERDDPYPSEESINALIDEYLNQAGVADISEDFPGITRELARTVLPVATYSQMYWMGNLHNLLHFIRLRSDSHAQYEIREYSDTILELIEPHVPWSIQAFKDYRMEGGSFSRVELSILKDLYNTLPIERKESIQQQLADEGASQREIKEFIGRLSKNL